MKKYVYLCAMMLLSLDIMAQIDPYDKNWKTVVFDDFDQPNRQFDTTFQEPDSLWTAFSHWNDPSGVTKHGDFNNNHQIYHWDHCLIDAPKSVLKLWANYEQNTEITCSDNYRLPPPIFGKVYNCDIEKRYLYFYSGMIESYPVYDSSLSICQLNNEDGINETPWKGRFRYGYYEMKCKMPIHEGAFVAFWLWGAKSNYYESIDIFEHSWEFTDTTVHPENNVPLGSPRLYLNRVHVADDYKNVFPVIPNNEEDLSGWHVFSCEWQPDHVTFYRDSKVTAEQRELVPSHDLALKVTYAIDRYALQNNTVGYPPDWLVTDTMFIDYIKVYQLIWDCGTEEVLSCQTDLNDFHYGVKKSINITSSNEDVRVADTCHVTFRATDFFEITGPFQVDSGGELTVIMQECPDANIEENSSHRKNSTP